MWILNIPGYYLPTGFHPDPGENSILIQIGDPDSNNDIFPLRALPVPKHNFKEQHQFRFLDMTDDHLDKLSPELQEYFGSRLITDEQATAIANILTEAYNNKSNVIVHCTAGICRSGAIVEVGVMMGFEDISDSRIPNLLVKRKLLKQLGYSYE